MSARGAYSMIQTSNDDSQWSQPFTLEANVVPSHSVMQEKPNIRAGNTVTRNGSRPAPFPLVTNTTKWRRSMTLAGIALAFLLLIVAIFLPLYFFLRQKSNNMRTPSSTASPNSNPPGKVITGGDGSIVTTEDGSTFIYNNTFGGYWWFDPTDPFNESARPQQDVPPLNQTWMWGVNVIQGVNLGGWLVTEPFITPALYSKYPGAIDEYTLSTLMRADTAGGGIEQLEEHYKTFITERDFAEIASAGLNWIRLPIPYWAIETWDGEPFLAKVSWKYALKAFEWARKYGLRINLDLHSVPGSQNPWWHSGRAASPNFLIGPMGYANAQRTLDYIRIITEFISQDHYKNVIPMFGIVNEPVLPQAELERFYFQAYQTVRAVTGLGAGHGPFVSLHDGFGSLDNWAGFLRGSDRLAIDRHPYFAFGGANADPLTAFVTRPCQEWAAPINVSMSTFGITSAGEWSLAFNDCGLYVTGVNQQPSYLGNCTEWESWESWAPDLKENLKLFALNQMSALQNFFFWTWKVGPADDGRIRAPLWSYQLGHDNGWIPKNPRDAAGVCASTTPFSAASFQPWQLGGPGAGDITSPTTAYTDWPPAGAQYLYTPNRPIPKLPPPSFPSAAANVDPDDGWTNDSDTALSVGPNPGCVYPNSWNEGGDGAGGAACTPRPA